jgi:predicted DNA-binding protein (UPF0251 family)
MGELIISIQTPDSICFGQSGDDDNDVSNGEEVKIKVEEIGVIRLIELIGLTDVRLA